MEQSWRWFGPGDLVPLHAIRQAGATGVVTALHQIPYGEVWSVAAIEARQAEIGSDASLGLHWNVVESLPIHERIKLGEGDLTSLFDNYRHSMLNLAACGVRTICYNFMPVVDWTRTELAHALPGGGRALRFNAHEYAAFDCFMLERPGAEADHPEHVLTRARSWFANASEGDKATLLASIMAGLPGAFDRYDIPALRKMLDRYKGIDGDSLRANLARFLREVIPLAEELGIRMAIHPDDPPRPLMGLPRIVSNAEDLAFITKAVDSEVNGITFCTGSLGAGVHNDVTAMARQFASRIHFAHLRNVAKEPDGSFMEADHLGGDTDMVSVIEALLIEQKRRREEGRQHWRLPFRPDHGHELLDDVGKGSFPGYSAVGRLKGLAELRGVMTAVAQLKSLPL
ncbi:MULTISPECIES: mannonate dehydratase [unclassified Chelatococcus]|uniref:mannonate dehydratase n=1 Tax=unclassified Chelatococcus TaxID=2638111 RepID=UPI001BD11759|nr:MULTISPECIES: mannonate dehydratase [unclassified Chelatococcus]MBS7701205.1 mannonate dehydratase [Chelatococcus sp. YT9]MBX3557336.1 mannonate dehydratase [Chelatococcus sp.]